MQRSGVTCHVVPWDFGFKDALVNHANNKEVQKNLLDQFPYPYTAADADFWLGYCQHEPQKYKNMAIVVQNGQEQEAIGGVGVYPSVEANQGHVAKAGYWLAQPYWGRGIATEALSMMLEMSQTAEWANICNSGNPIVRYEAEIFEWNAASARVLEKNGFSLEARLTKSYFKDGKFVDGLLYAKVL